MLLPTDDEYHTFPKIKTSSKSTSALRNREPHASRKKTNSKALMKFPRGMMIGKALLSDSESGLLDCVQVLTSSLLRPPNLQTACVCGNYLINPMLNDLAEAMKALDGKNERF